MMSKNNYKQKRAIGKESPLSKRPKLDFTLKNRTPPRNKIGKDLLYHYDNTNEKNSPPNSTEKKHDGNLPTTSDWDDDFSGDMLEKVCLIADLSQAMVNNQATPKSINQEKIELEVFEENKCPIPSTLDSSGNVKIIGELEKLKLEYEKLKEKFKTKEGEVHILRSQLKQNEDAKQAVALQNINVIQEMQRKFNEKISNTEKELETTKTKLLFKDMEYKTLSERCRQLEYNKSKNKFSENNESFTDIVKTFPNHANSISSQIKKNKNEKSSISISSIKDWILTSKKPVENSDYFELLSHPYHEGKFLAKMICPELFKFIDEPSIVPLYTFNSGISCHKSILDLDRREKYKWSDLPEQTTFLQDIYNYVSSLFEHESFTQREIKITIESIFSSCGKILIYYKEVFLFLEKLQLHSNENDDPDQSLLENEDEVKIVTVKNLLDGVKLKEEECGIEGRRCLGLLYSLMKTSQTVVNIIKNNYNFMVLLKELAAGIGNLRRPLRYSGILIGISFILQRVLLEKDLSKDVLTLINGIVEEIIFARPKLDVLREVINILAAGKYHLEFLVAMCRKASVESCALYIDSKLKQAMFFTKNACPLKILCMQIMGVACLPSSVCIIWDVTNCVIKWLNNTMSIQNAKEIKWLPLNSQDGCFDVTECLLYLLSLCLKDYNVRFAHQDNEDCEMVVQGLQKMELTKKKAYLISIIGHGAVLLKRILKADGRRLHDNTHCLRFAMLLKLVMGSKSDIGCLHFMSHINSVQIDAIFWIIDLLDSDLKNQDGYLKQTTSALPEIDIFSALKINDDKMF